MQKRAFVEHFVGGRLTALSWLSRGGVDASTRRRLQADGFVARQAAQGRRVRVQQGALTTPSKRCKYTNDEGKCLNKECGITCCVDCLSKVAEVLRRYLELHPGTTFVKHKVWDILLREVFTSGASHESDVDVFRPREGGGGEWVRCCPVCIDQDLPDPVISTVQTESGKEYADLPPKLLSVTTIAVPARIPNYDGTEGPRPLVSKIVHIDL